MKDRFRLPAFKGSRSADGQYRAAIFHDSPLPMLVCDPSGVITEINASLAALLEYDQGALLGRPLRELVHAEDAVEEMHLFHELVAGRRNPYQKETRFRRADGETLCCLVTAFPTGEAVEGNRLFAAILDDVTERRAQEDAYAAQTGGALMSPAEQFMAAASLDDAVPPLLRMLGEGGGWDLAAFWTQDAEGSALRCTALWHAPGMEFPSFEAITVERAFPLGVGLVGHAWQERAPLWSDDLSKDDNVIRTLKATREGLQTGFAFPVVIYNEVYGVVELYSRELRKTNPRQMVSTMANGMQLARFFEQQRAAATIAASEERYQTLIAATSDTVVTVDETGTILDVNAATEGTFGYGRGELLGLPLTTLMPENMRQSHLAGLQRYRATGLRKIRWEGLKLPGLHKDGSKLELEIFLSESTRDGKPVFTGMMRNITEKQAEESALVRQALHDLLTDLPNRSLLLDRLQQSILVSQSNGTATALLALDLNRFKEVNDTFGFQRGDDLLKEVAARLTSVTRPADTLARLGGDEFALLMPAGDENSAIGAALRIMDVMKAPFIVDQQRFELSATAGIAVYPTQGQDADTLLQHADDALRTAKKATAAYMVYAADSDDRSSLRLLLSGELREAIHTDQLMLYYQPKLNLSTGRTGDVEALVRWQHPQRGFIPPDGFIPLAEETGLVTPLTVWVINEALRQHKTWFDFGYKIRVAVNFSARSLSDPHLVETVSRLLRSWSVEPSYLVAEITESAIMIDPERSLTTLKALRNAGLLIAIDDFGTGYSSLNYLKKLPADELKIDKSFVLDMATERDDASIVRSVIGLGHNLGMHVVAEGVDNKRSLDMLAEMGCDMAQGFFLSRPVPASELTDWLSSSSGRLAGST